MRAAICLLFCALLSACGNGIPQPTVSLRVKGNVPDASVTVDDQYLGALAFVEKRGVAMPVGMHRVTVEKPGYFPWDRLVEAKDAPVYLQVELVKIPD